MKESSGVQSTKPRYEMEAEGLTSIANLRNYKISGVQWEVEKFLLNPQQSTKTTNITSQRKNDSNNFCG